MIVKELKLLPRFTFQQMWCSPSFPVCSACLVTELVTRAIIYKYVCILSAVSPAQVSLTLSRHSAHTSRLSRQQHRAQHILGNETFYLELQTIHRFSQSWRRPLLGSSPGWKRLLHTMLNVHGMVSRREIGTLTQLSWGKHTFYDLCVGVMRLLT